MTFYDISMHLASNSLHRMIISIDGKELSRIVLLAIWYTAIVRYKLESNRSITAVYMQGI